MSTSRTDDTPPVTERNTKQEILAAYQRLREQSEGRLTALPFDAQRGALQDSLQTFVDLKSKLGSDLDRLAETLRTDLGRLEDVQTKTNQEKQRLAREFDEQVRRIEAEATRLNDEWEQAKTAAAAEDAEKQARRGRERKREEEEYQYQRDLERRKEADTYAETKTRRETELAAREADLASREAAVAAKEQELTEFPKRIEEATAAARREVTTELTRAREQTTKELAERQDHAAAVAQLKIDGLEAALKTHAAEIDTIRREKTDLTRQLKEMALAALDSRSKPAAAAQNPSSPQT